jgi:phosphopantothenoylcysteine decarboxylase/phosphopantothenate--cysteine ligase
MGFALAEECASRGAAVTLVCGPVHLQTSHPNIKRVDVVSAEEMFAQVKKAFDKCDIAISCAAVADFTPKKEAAKSKIKRGENGLTIELKPTTDIAGYLGEHKKTQKLVGFALETDNEECNALSKLKRKNLDFIVLNSLKDKNAGFQYDTNKITIISADGEKKTYGLKPKTEVAKDIVDKIETIL